MENYVKAAIKKKWVAALKSGKYEQTTAGRLTNKEGTQFCCLGVLCDIYLKEMKHPIKNRFHRANAIQQLRVSDDAKIIQVPGRKVLTWAGLHHSSTGTLADMNDVGKSFEVIAKYIEKAY